MMKTDVEFLKQLFIEAYEEYEDSYAEALRVWEYFHNRQLDENVINTLNCRGQPKETFNIIKMFSRILLGYYSTVITDIVVKPIQAKNILKAAVLTDVIKVILRQNDFMALGNRIKLSALLAGLCVGYINVKNTNKQDEYGRPIREIDIDYVPYNQIVLDPLSTEPDYNDARFIHRFKWVFKDEMEKAFGKAKVEKLAANENQLGTIDNIDNTFNGNFALGDMYLLVHTCIENDKGEVESIYWCGDVELDRKPFKLKGVKFPYVVTKVNDNIEGEKKEFYGIFREIIESQDAINQAIWKIQTMVNTQKIFVEEQALDGSVQEFIDLVNRVNAVIPVRSIQGIKVENLSKDIVDQYRIIDNALERIKMTLGINDSFLGLAFAADSGRKVKIQKNSAIMALNYLTQRIEQFYKNLGEIIVAYVKNYYTAHQVFRLTDDIIGERWIELNKPLRIPKAVNPQTGEIEYEEVWEQQVDPQTGEPLIINGKYVVAPMPEKDTEVAFDDFEIEVKTASFTDEDEKNQIMLETVLSGNIGAMLAKINPAGYFKVVGLSLREMKTKYSPIIAEILEETSAILQKNVIQQEEAKMAAQGRVKDNRKSQELKLPEGG